jgi:hypothetical protein
MAGSPSTGWYTHLALLGISNEGNSGQVADGSLSRASTFCTMRCFAVLLRDTENADVGGVHGADEKSGNPGSVMGEVPLASARCRVSR